jgi:hypothetical protein
MPVPTLLTALFLASASSASSEPMDRTMIVKAFDEVAFVPIIPSRPNGPKIGVMRGDPDAGPSDMLLKMPKGPGVLHTHTADYHLTVISGEMKHWDASSEEAKVRQLGPGSYWFQPGGEAHADSCLSDECVMFIHWSGKRDGLLVKPR